MAGLDVHERVVLVGEERLLIPIAREAFYLVIPATFMSHRRVTRFLELVVEELSTARGELPGYSFETLGRVQPLVPEAAAPQ